MEQDHVNEEQSALWNGPSGRAWVDIQPSLDRLFEPFATLLADAAAASSARAVLDVGCGRARSRSKSRGGSARTYSAWASTFQRG